MEKPDVIQSDGNDTLGHIQLAKTSSLRGNQFNLSAPGGDKWLRDLNALDVDPSEADDKISGIALTKKTSLSIQHIDLSVVESGQAVTKFNASDEEFALLEGLAKSIFNDWDITRDGTITADEIIASDLDDEFAAAVGRVLDCSGTGKIYLRDLTQCLTILKFGTLEARVSLLVKFMDSNNNNRVSFEEAEKYMKIAPFEICKKLGFFDHKGVTRALRYEDILALFQNSDRGEEAISVFCEQILRILSSRNRGRTLSRSLGDVLVHGPNCNFIGQQIINMVKHIEKSTIFLMFLVLLQMGLWLINFFRYRQEGKPLAFCIAKGFGMNLRILSLFLFLSMARTTMGLLYNFKSLRPLLPIGFNIQLHSFCGFCTIFHSFGHMFGHIAYHDDHVEGGFTISFKQPSLLRGASWLSKGSGDAISGYILLTTILVMGITALLRGYGSKAYLIFSNVHFLYSLWIVFLFFHVPHLWPWFLSILVLMICERTYDMLFLTVYSSLQWSRPCSNGVTFLSIPNGGKTSYPGSYYRVKIPALSLLEWHPFSLAGSASSHHLTFFVASTGDWTSQLHQLVSDPIKRNKCMIFVQGPFYAPAYAASKNETDNNVLVASGIGITPFFSIMATKVTRELNFEHDKSVYASLFRETLSQRGGSQSFIKTVQRGLQPEIYSGEDIKMLHVIWTIREVTELMFYLDYVYELVKQQEALAHPVVVVDVYLTGLGKNTQLSYMLSQTLFLLSVSAKTSRFMKIHFGRPDLRQSLHRLHPDSVFYCGGSVLKDTLKDLCVVMGCEFHPEDFDAGAHFVADTVKKVTAFFKDRARTAKNVKRTRSSSIPPSQRVKSPVTSPDFIISPKGTRRMSLTIQPSQRRMVPNSATS